MYTHVRYTSFFKWKHPLTIFLNVITTSGVLTFKSIIHISVELAYLLFVCPWCSSGTVGDLSFLKVYVVNFDNGLPDELSVMNWLSKAPWKKCTALFLQCPWSVGCCSHPGKNHEVAQLNSAIAWFNFVWMLLNKWFYYFSWSNPLQ